MIFLYTFALFFLGAIKLLVNRRVASLEKKYLKTVDQVDHLLREPALKNGSNSKVDVGRAAKHQVKLGLMLEKQDRLEAKYEDWQKRAARFNAMVERVRGWKGKKLPYTMGVVDVSLVLTVIDYLGVGNFVSPRYLIEMVAALVTN